MVNVYSWVSINRLPEQSCPDSDYTITKHSMWNSLLRNGQSVIRQQQCVLTYTYYNIAWKITAPFNNMRTLKLEAQLTNGFFAAVNQVFAAPPSFRLLPSTVSLSELCSTIWLPHAQQPFGSWEESPNTWLTVAQNAFVGWAQLNVRVLMLLKGAVSVPRQIRKTTKKLLFRSGQNICGNVFPI